MFATIKEAKENDEKYYFTGKQCKNNHVSKRVTSNGSCYTCLQINKQNLSKLDSYKEKDRLRGKRYRLKYPDKVAKRNKLLNKIRVETGNNRLKCAKRRVQKLLATPPWADLEIIKEFYLKCPKGYEVDHITPLKGKNVCGLHVANNLQYLTPKDNASKGNRF